MNIAYVIAALLLVPAFLITSNMMVCQKDKVWTFDPRKHRCDAAYLTVIVGFAAIMIVLLVREFFPGSSIGY